MIFNPLHRKKKKPSFKAFYFVLALGYLAVGIVILIFFLAGINSGWSFTGDSAGGIGLVYAATIMVPHILIFLFALVYVTVGALSYWPQLSGIVRTATLLYLLLSLLILAANLTDSGGYLVPYYARKLFAPSYYDPPRPETLLRNDPALRKLAGQMDEAADRYFRDANPQTRDDLEIYLDFLTECARERIKENQKEEYRAYQAASSLRYGSMLRRVHSLGDAIVEERYEYRYRSYPTGERIDKALETMVKEGYCGKVHDFESFRRSFYRGRQNLYGALNRWEFDRKLDTRDLLLWDKNTLLVADGNRGVELWKKQDGKWHYVKTLDAHSGGAVRIAQHGGFVDVYHIVSGQRDDTIIRYRYDPGRRILSRIASIDIDGAISFVDWTADASGRHLFLAGGYRFVIMIDWGARQNTPVKHRARSSDRNNWANDVAWDERSQKLYIATHYGIAICDESSFDKRKGHRCDTYPLPPYTQGVILLPDEKLFVVSDELKQTITLRLFAVEHVMPHQLAERRDTLSMHGRHIIRGALPRNLTWHDGRLFLTNGEEIHLFDANLSLQGCLYTGASRRFIFCDDHTLIVAKGEKGVAEIPLNISKSACARKTR